MDLNFDFGGLSLDGLTLDLGDFNLDGEETKVQTRIIQPRMDKNILLQKSQFAHAEDFTDEIDLSGKTRTFAWISGDFVFGDILEALETRRGISIRELYISTLSLSEANLESWRRLMEHDKMQRFDLLISSYFYSHEKNGLIPKIYEHLDYKNIFQVAFGPYHCKLMCFLTEDGKKVTIHGSANARSNTGVEHIMVELDEALYDFNVDHIHDVVTRYGTINHSAKPQSRAEVRKYFNELRKKKTG